MHPTNRRRLTWVVVLAATCILILAGITLTRGAGLPAPTGQYVADFAGVLTKNQVETLGTTLKKFETASKSKTQVVAVLPASLEGLPVEDYANQMFREWKIGQQGTNNGILIIVAPKERKLRLEIGYGLEGAIPDSKALSIINKMAEQTRNGKNDWGGAIQVAATELAPLLGAEDEVLGAQPTASPWGVGLIFGVLALMILFAVWRAFRHEEPDTDGIPLEMPPPRPRSYSNGSSYRRSAPRRSSASDDYVAGAAAGTIASGGWSSSDSSSSSSSDSGGYSGGGGDSGGGGASGDA